VAARKDVEGEFEILQARFAIGDNEVYDDLQNDLIEKWIHSYHAIGYQNMEEET
jgi:UTP:GlnB (protein PII) uridylyltransferase